jgi:hypothetical protein
MFVQAVEDIGKEADKWDDEEPLTADNEFTVSYGVSETDRSNMLSVIRSISKRRLARGFGVVIGGVAVWYIAPTTAGGTLVIFVITLAGYVGISQIVRWLFAGRKARLAKPEWEQRQSTDGDLGD